MHRRLALTTVVCCVAALGATACGGGGGEADKTIKVAYQDFGTFHAADRLFKKIKPEFEKQHAGWTLQLVPIEAAENDYYTKLNLMQRSAETAPDVLYEDTFLINSDVAAGYLAPLDSYLAEWQDWEKFIPASKQAAKAKDGKVYGVPMSTDTRGLWYNKQLFAKAGLPTDWKPKTWDDVLSTARTLKRELPGVVPLNVYSGKPMGEASTMQGFEMLLYGTEETLYDQENNKWIAPGTGFTDSLDFIRTIYTEGLAPKPQQALNPNFGTVVTDQWLPKGKLAIDLDGNWIPGTTWAKGNAHPWPEWSEVMGWTAMPTQNGQEPGVTTLSGGWTLSVGEKSDSKDVAWDLIELALNKENSLEYAKSSGTLAVRTDVAEDPAYLEGQPHLKFWTDLVEHTHYRPAYAEYPQISNRIQEAMEAVMTEQASPQEAAATYGGALEQIVGPDNVARR